MAEIVESGGGKKKGGTKGKKLSTRVDLTPMVDLGFLLITFFMFTTTMSKPKTMEIIMPVEDSTIEKPDEVKDYTAMTVLLSKKNRVYYYYGIGSGVNPPKVEVTTFKPKGGVRDAVIYLKKYVDSCIQAGIPGSNAKDFPVVLIKPDSTSKYDDMVNILDEMSINSIKSYALVDITDVDREFIRRTEEANANAENNK